MNHILAVLALVAVLLASSAEARHDFDRKSAFGSGSGDSQSTNDGSSASQSSWWSSSGTSGSTSTPAWQDRLKQAYSKYKSGWPSGSDDYQPSSSSGGYQPSSNGGYQPSSGSGGYQPSSGNGGYGQDNSPGTGGSSGDSNPVEPTTDSGNTGGGGDAVSDSVLQGVLSLHNSYRAKHGVPALTWSSSIAATAQSYSRGCVMQHSSNSYGENLAKGHRSFNAAVSDWYSESNGYSYNGGISGAGHFTQMVWKSTTQLGCGYSSCGGSPLYVCNYNPAGNYVGRVQQNVFPPRN